MPTELEMWLLFGYFVCVMFQAKNKKNKKNKNGVNLPY